MAKNDLKLFAGGSSANVMPQAEYEAMLPLINGFSTGVAQSKQLNKVWRQSSFVAAMIGLFTGNNSGEDVLDDSDVDGFEAKFARAMQAFIANQTATGSFWQPVISMTVTAPPASPAVGDAYVIPASATGAWAGSSNSVAVWMGSDWKIFSAKNGHGISLPDGRVFEKVSGTYVEKIALDVQSGKWNVATATGAANALAVALTPAPSSYSDGLIVAVRPSATTTSTNPTINVNGLGAKAITNPNGTALAIGAIKASALVLLIYNSSTDKFNVITSDRQPGQAIAVLANGTNYDIPFGVLVETSIKVNATSLYDTNNAYSLANGTYTVPEAGIYVFSVNFSFDAPSNGTIRLWIKKNGVKLGESSTASPRVLALTVNVRCEVGDVISLSADSSVAYTKAAMAPASYFASSFSGALLGK